MSETTPITTTAGGPAAVSRASDAADLDRLRPRFDHALNDFLDGQAHRLSEIADGLALPLQAVTDLTAAGKRLRPAFCYWAWRGAGHDHEPGASAVATATVDADAGHSAAAADAARVAEDPIVIAAAALELLHVAALIHDDVIDDSDRRRGRPATHRRIADLHRSREWNGSAERFGAGGAVLFGDLALCWSDEMLRSAGFGPQQLLPALRYFDQMRTEVTAGQYLDLTNQASGAASMTEAMRVVRFKSAKYTVERPLHIGAALGGAATELVEAYSAYGVPLGEAFQLRDDVLGVFGDPEVTGKPAGDDLREGKRTALVAGALEASTPERAERFRREFGRADLDDQGVAALCEIIVESGALATVERLIRDLTDTAHTALAGAPIADEHTRAALGALAEAATQRTG